TSAPSVQASCFDSWDEGVDGHPIGRDGILVDVKQQSSARSRGMVMREQVVPAGRDCLTVNGEALLGKPVFQIAAQPSLQKVGTSQGAPHGVDARNRDQVRQEAGQLVHVLNSLKQTSLSLQTCPLLRTGGTSLHAFEVLARAGIDPDPLTRLDEWRN